MVNCQDSIVVLHGWRSSKEKWEKVKMGLEREGFRVIIPDFPGFGEEDLKKAWNLDDYLNWTKDFIEKKIHSGELSENFFLLGHSFGGRVAIKFSVKYPEKLKGLILVSSAGIKPKKRLISKFSPLLKKLSFLPGYDFFRKVFYKFIIRRSDYLKVEGAMKETFKNIIEEDLTAVLSQVKTDTFIVWGKEDKMTPINDAYLMNKKIENSKLEVLENIGHAPYIENPDLLAKKILEFTKSKT